MKHRPDIDGLRTLAVVPVVLFHAGIAGFGGGYVGVDIFFVISGYLITGTIHEEMRAGSFNLARFYNRRVRRIFPALGTVLLATAVGGALLLVPEDLSQLGRSLAATALFVSNILFWHESGYFDTATELKPLLHTWSLAVEEQFYLVFPLLLAVVRLRWDARLCAWLALMASFAAGLLAMHRDASGAFYLLHARAWELLAGAVIALRAVPVLRSAAVREAAGLAGLALIAVPVLAYTRATPFPGEAALPPCLGAALIILSGEGEGRPTLAARLLSLRPMVFVGLVSYSLYLWHWPVIVALKYYAIEPPTLPQRLAAIALAFGLAVLSWRFVEQPVRRARGAGNGRVLSLAGLGTVAAAALGLLVAWGATTPAYIDRAYGAAFRRAEPYARQTASRGECVGKLMAELRAGNCLIGGGDGPASVALLGDSFADSLTQALAAALAPGGRSIAPYIWYSCPSILGTTRREAMAWAPGFVRDCKAYMEAAVREIAADPAIRTVVVANNYDWYLNRVSTVNGEPILVPDEAPQGGGSQGSDGNDERLKRKIVATVGLLAGAGKRVVFVGTSPTGHEAQGAAAILRKIATGRFTADETIPPENCRDSTAALGAELAHAYGGAFVYLDLESYFRRGEGPDAACAMTKEGLPLTTDGSHLSALVLGDLSRRIAAAVAAP